MTTTPAHSITDEQIAEIEKSAKYCVNEVIRSHPWSEMDFDCLRADERYIQAISPDFALAIITRLREAEKDAARYRWLREQEAEKGLAVLYVTGWERAATCWALTYPDPKALDVEIDTAMQGEQ